MSELLKKLPLTVQSNLPGLIYTGQKIAAIKMYREATGCDLTTAKQAIETISTDLKVRHSSSFINPKQNADRRIGKIVVLAFLITAVAIALLLLPKDYFNQFLNQSAIVTEPNNIRTTTTPSSITKSQPSQIKTIPVPPQPELNAPPAQAEIKAEDTPQTYEPKIPPDKDMDLGMWYQEKLLNPAYIAWRNQPGLAQGYQDFIEEHYIKYRRAEITGQQQPPLEAEIIKIPLLPDSSINIDGKIDDNEWNKAQRLLLLPASTETTFYVQADNDWLYLVANVPLDKTETGFDQLRFYFHLDIDPLIRNERIHINAHNKNNTPVSIRETSVRWQGAIPDDENQAWKKQPISDWNIYQLAKAQSGLHPHRQFEAKLHLKESGIHIGVPFSAFIEVETDPLYVNGKFKQRQYLGELGRQDQPLWMLIQ